VRVCVLEDIFGVTVVVVIFGAQDAFFTDISQFLTIHSCRCRSYPSEHRLTASHQWHSNPIFAVKHESQVCNEAQAIKKSNQSFYYCFILN
jgi:hypothetical protein